MNRTAITSRRVLIPRQRSRTTIDTRSDQRGSPDQRRPGHGLIKPTTMWRKTRILTSPRFPSLLQLCLDPLGHDLAPASELPSPSERVRLCCGRIVSRCNPCGLQVALAGVPSRCYGRPASSLVSRPALRRLCFHPVGFAAVAGLPMIQRPWPRHQVRFDLQVAKPLAGSGSYTPSYVPGR